jgi:hypothetical protein
LGLVVVAVALWVWTREPRQVRPPAAAEAPAAQTEARPAQVRTAGRGERPAAVAPVAQAPPPGALRPGLLVAVTDVGGGPIADARLMIGEQEMGRTGADGTATLAPERVPGKGELCAVASGYADACRAFAVPGRVTLALQPGSGVDGVVVRVGDGQPVAGAAVFTDEAETVSDQEGRFSLRGLGPGQHRLEARGDHFYGRAARDLSLGLGYIETGVRLEVQAAFVVRGRVTAAGAPMTGATVTIDDDRDTQTDERGDYRLGGVPPGRYRVAVAGTVSTAARARDVEVRDRDLVVDLDLGPLHRLAVLVVDPANRPIADVRVEGLLVRGGLRAKIRCQTDERGRCSLGPFSSGAIEGLRPAGAAPVTLEVPPADPAPLRFVLQGLGAVRGTLIGADRLPGVRPVLELTDRAPDGIYWASRAVGPDGRFAFTPVPPGRYHLRVLAVPAADPEAPPSVIDQDPPLLEQEVELAPGETRELQLRLEQVTGRLAGVVSEPGGGAAADVVVTYRPAYGHERGQPFKPGIETAVTDESGRFSFESVPRGRRYRVMAHRSAGESATAEDVTPGEAPLQLRLAPHPGRAAR